MLHNSMVVGILTCRRSTYAPSDLVEWKTVVKRANADRITLNCRRAGEQKNNEKNVPDAANFTRFPLGPWIARYIIRQALYRCMYIYVYACRPYVVRPGSPTNHGNLPVPFRAALPRPTTRRCLKRRCRRGARCPYGVLMCNRREEKTVWPFRFSEINKNVYG